MLAALPGWRDAAMILLCIEAFVGTAAVGVALYAGLRGLAELVLRLRPWLFQARLTTWQVCERINGVMRSVARPFVRLHSVAAGLGRARRALFPSSVQRAERGGILSPSSQGEFPLSEGGSQ